MGSPVSAVMADIVMEDLEQKALSTFLTSPQLWKRYVDDVCSAAKSTELDEFQKYRLNSIERSIQFTIETENNQDLSFLDVCVGRQNNGQLTTKYIVNQRTQKDIYLLTLIIQCCIKRLLLDL